jgi:hypothetical protein
MQQIDPKAGAATVRSRLRTLGTRLRSRPDTLALAAPVDAAQVDLRDKHEAWLAAHDATLAATGAIVFADEVEDDEIARVARRAKVLVDGVLKSPTYLRLFAVAPSEVTKGLAGDAQAALANHLITALAAPEYASLADAIPALKAARAEVEGALAARTACEVAEASAWTELQIAEEAGRNVYRDAEPQLQLLFPGQRRLVDSFFYQEPRAHKSAPDAAPG